MTYPVYVLVFFLVLVFSLFPYFLFLSPDFSLSFSHFLLLFFSYRYFTALILAFGWPYWRVFASKSYKQFVIPSTNRNYNCISVYYIVFGAILFLTHKLIEFCKYLIIDECDRSLNVINIYSNQLAFILAFCPRASFCRSVSYLSSICSSLVISICLHIPDFGFSSFVEFQFEFRYFVRLRFEFSLFFSKNALGECICLASTKW